MGFIKDASVAIGYLGKYLYEAWERFGETVEKWFFGPDPVGGSAVKSDPVPADGSDPESIRIKIYAIYVGDGFTDPLDKEAKRQLNAAANIIRLILGREKALVLKPLSPPDRFEAADHVAAVLRCRHFDLLWDVFLDPPIVEPFRKQAPVRCFVAIIDHPGLVRIREDAYGSMGGSIPLPPIGEVLPIDVEFRSMSHGWATILNLGGDIS